MASVDFAIEDQGEAERLIVNKGQLARILKTSLPTLNVILEEYPDFPVEFRGSHGVEWQFDAQKAVDYMAAQEEAEKQRNAAKRELFKQFTLPIDDLLAGEAKALDPGQRLKLAQTRKIEDQLARETGKLVPTSEVWQNIQPGIAEIMRWVENLPRRQAAFFKLPDEVAVASRAWFDQDRGELMAKLEAMYAE